MGNKGANNRQRIVSAADQLFYQRGYNQTSFRDISNKTGIPRGNFYYYFKTKEDILGAVVESRVSDFQKMLKACDDQVEDPRQRILCFADMLVSSEENVLNTGCPIGTLSSELAKDESGFQELSQAVFSVVRQWLSKQFNALGCADSDEKAMDLMARMQGVTVMACTFNDRQFLRKSVENIKSWINKLTSS